MFDRAKEERDLKKAEHEIALAQERIAKLEVEIKTAREDGHDTTLGEKALETMKSTLTEFVKHRDGIREIIQTIDKFSRDGPS
jgi:predicted  nucleic acid-binding Zn-ribbon protein